MRINEYQKLAHTFADYNEPFLIDKEDNVNSTGFVYPAMGLAEESGEVLGKFAKIVRDDNGVISQEKKTEIIKELGDVCWFVAELSTYLNIPLEEVMKKNIEKLTSRRKRGVIHGSGDNR